ncbi:MAG: SpoIID/LytB domain-containing protein [Pirellulales bacterium]|nr:SpoIID/LytB domain-containing protein [Pirellulales bacterium]
MLTAAVLLAVATWRLSAPPAAMTRLRDREADFVASTLPPVRVRLGQASEQVSLRIEGPYRVMARGDWRVLAQGPRLEETFARVADDRLHLGERPFAAQQVDLHVLAPGSLWVEGRRYPGHLRLVRDGEQRLLVVNVVELEQYVAGVVEAEMPASFPLEARAAQAVAARSFVLCQMKTSGVVNEFDVEDGTGAQVYRGLPAGDATLSTAATLSAQEIAERTRGIALTYQGRIFSTHYCATCGGSTADGRAVFAAAAPPLVSVPCEFCQQAPRYRWEVELPRAWVSERAQQWCAARGRRLGPLVSIEIDSAPAGGVATMHLRGREGETALTAHEFRQQLVGVERLPSAVFELIDEGDTWRARGRGFGHRVGMCQWGARTQAQLGRSCQEILAHYYPGAALSVVE